MPLIYSSKLVQIPVLRFVVFYNGTQEQPERRVLRLSDAFEKKVSSPELEVTVTMLNINPGNNRELMEKCRTLREYCMFVECIRKYAEQMDIGEAVEHAVTECIRNDILADFLSAQRAEVIAMSIFEYNEEEEMKKIRADEFSVGRETGKAEGKAEFVIELLENLGDTGQSAGENSFRIRSFASEKMVFRSGQSQNSRGIHGAGRPVRKHLSAGNPALLNGMAG